MDINLRKFQYSASASVFGLWPKNFQSSSFVLRLRPNVKMKLRSFTDTSQYQKTPSFFPWPSITLETEPRPHLCKNVFNFVSLTSCNRYYQVYSFNKSNVGLNRIGKLSLPDCPETGRFPSWTPDFENF